jgi:hypothetical protein
MVELLDLGPPGLAQSLENGRGVRDRASHDLAYALVRFVGRQRGATIGDELVQIKHGHIPFADAVVRSDQTCSRIAGAHAFYSVFHPD